MTWHVYSVQFIPDLHHFCNTDMETARCCPDPRRIRYRPRWRRQSSPMSLSPRAWWDVICVKVGERLTECCERLRPWLSIPGGQGRAGHGQTPNPYTSCHMRQPGFWATNVWCSGFVGMHEKKHTNIVLRRTTFMYVLLYNYPCFYFVWKRVLLWTFHCCGHFWNVSPRSRSGNSVAALTWPLTNDF